METDLVRLMVVLGRVSPSIWDAIVPHGPGRTAVFRVSPGSEVELNPQPIPPGRSSIFRVSPGSEVELNPQPIPPGHELQFASASVANEIARAAIAAEAAGSEGGSRIVSRAVDDWCGTPHGHVPIPWPHQWPFPWPPHNREPELDVEASQVVGGLALASIASRMSDGEVRDALAKGAEQLLQAGLSG